MTFAAFLVCSLVGVAIAQEYTASNYPNPRKGGFAECNLGVQGLLCDPYAVLNQSERLRLNSELSKFAGKIEEDTSNDLCPSKGTDVILALINEGSQAFADDLRKEWTADRNCGGTAILLLSTNDRHLYGSFGSHSPITANDVSSVVASEEGLLRTGKYTTAMVNVMKELSNKQDPLGIRSTTPKQSAARHAVLPTMVAVLMALLL